MGPFRDALAAILGRKHQQSGGRICRHSRCGNIRPAAAVRTSVCKRTREQQMLKILGGTVGIIFLIGLLVVIGVLSLIF